MSNDEAYYNRRGEAELMQAEQATHPKVTAAYDQFAEPYFARFASPPMGITPS